MSVYIHDRSGRINKVIQRIIRIKFICDIHQCTLGYDIPVALCRYKHNVRKRSCCCGRQKLRIVFGSGKTRRIVYLDVRVLLLKLCNTVLNCLCLQRGCLPSHKGKLYCIICGCSHRNCRHHRCCHRCRHYYTDSLLVHTVPP